LGSLNNGSWSGVSDRIDGWWNQFPPQDSAERALVDEQKQKQQQTQNLYEGKNQNLRTVEVSLDNADTVIEGGPFKLLLA